MLRNISAVALLGFLSFAANARGATDIDPDALKVLRTALQTVKEAQRFSVRARVARDRPATDGQILTYFQDERITVSRPDKVRADIDGEHHTVQFYYDAGTVTLYSPKAMVYASMQGPKTTDQMLEDLEKRDISFPMFYLLKSDPYAAIIDGITTGYVIGTVNVFDKNFVHLAFTEADADWQIWIELGEKPTIRRYEVVYKKRALQPRVVVDFSEWNFSASPDADLFTFKKPADAHQIEFLRNVGEK